MLRAPELVQRTGQLSPGVTMTPPGLFSFQVHSNSLALLGDYAIHTTKKAPAIDQGQVVSREDAD
jgi:hypothetical protein